MKIETIGSNVTIEMNVQGRDAAAGANTSTLSELDLSDLCDESFLRLLDEPFDPNENAARLRADAKYNGFDAGAGNMWIYPTNYPVRQYQFNICRASLFKNTLVRISLAVLSSIDFIASIAGSTAHWTWKNIYCGRYYVQHFSMVSKREDHFHGSNTAASRPTN